MLVATTTKALMLARIFCHKNKGNKFSCILTTKDGYIDLHARPEIVIVVVISVVVIKSNFD